VKKSIVVVVSAIGLATFLSTSIGAAAGPGGGAVRRDNGHGLWFRRACDLPKVSVGACGVQVVTNSAGSPLAATAPRPGSYGPAQFHAAYALPTTAPIVQTIAIVDAYNDPNIESDLGTYSSYYGLPACTTANGCFRKVNQSGGTTYPASNAGWSLEIALDVETAHQICQNCKILLVEASTASLANLGAAENEAVALGANVISNSWGATEYGTELTDEAQYFNHPGVVITASTGDNGYGVEFPAASRYVTAVGGTTLNLNSDNTWSSETAWSGAGSGCSANEPKPSWQTDTGCARRAVADVSADADPNTGAAVYDSVQYQFQSGWFQVGGTSLAAPLIGAVYALTGTAASANYGSTPYSHTSSLHDVTLGSNGSCGTYLCTAGLGYDGPTGLGTPNGLGAFMAGSSSPSPDFSVGVSPPSSTVTQGTNGVFTVSVGASGGFGGSVTLSQSGLPNGSFSTNPVAAPGSSTLTINTSAIGPGSYPFTVTGTSGSTTHTASGTLVVQAAPSGDFSISVTPSSRIISHNSTSTYTVTITPQNGFSGAVTLSASGFVSGLSGSFSTNPTTSSSTLTVVASNAPSSFFSPTTLTITGTGGGHTHSTTLALYIF
jgi:subtilase family serine protease